MAGGLLADVSPVFEADVFVDFDAGGAVEAVATRLFGATDPVVVAGFEVVKVGLEAGAL